MLLFFISFLFVLISSYLITSLITEKNSSLELLYMPVIGFAQIVLIFEILSLFNSINILSVLNFNILITIITYKFWQKYNKPLWYFEKEITSGFFNKIKNSFKLDKTLIVLGVCYLFLMCSSLYLGFLLPVVNGDGKSYHVARSFYYIINGNLNHFVINDIRALCMPFNSEILYAWIILFFKKDIYLNFFSFLGYIISVIALFSIMGYLKFSYRRRLWVIFIISSFASVFTQISGTETDLIITSLVLSSIYMFWTGLKTDKKIPLFMSALSYALATGTKTTSLIMIPGVGFLMIFLCFNHKKFKPFLLFLGYGILNFIIFSSYNYILNFIDYKNITGPDTFMVVSKNYDGIKGAFANFIRYMFLFFDFSGIKLNDNIMSALLQFKDQIFTGLSNYKEGLYSTDWSFQSRISEQYSGAGVLGFLVFLPCWIFALIKRKSFAFVFLINLICISFLLVFMSYNVRFVMEFMVISAPILACSYFSNKNLLKYIIIGFSVYYMVFASSNIINKPFIKIINYIKTEHPNIEQIREIATCSNFYTFDEKIDCKIRNNIKNYPKNTKILYLPEVGTNYVEIGKLILDGYKIDITDPELLIEKDLSKYDLIISPANYQFSTVIKDFEKRKNDCIVDADTDQIKVLNKREYDCYYEYNENTNNKDVPFGVACNTGEKYLKTKNFKLSRIVGIDSETENLISNYYYFYQNTKQ